MEKLLVCFTWLVQNNSQLKRHWESGGWGEGGGSGRLHLQCTISIQSLCTEVLRNFPPASGGEQPGLPCLGTGCPPGRESGQSGLPPRSSPLPPVPRGQGKNTFHKIFQLRLLLESWTPPFYAVLSNTNFADYWRQWTFETFRCFLCGGLVFRSVWLRAWVSTWGCFMVFSDIPSAFFFWCPFSFYDLFKHANQCTKARWQEG